MTFFLAGTENDALQGGDVETVDTTRYDINYSRGALRTFNAGQQIGYVLNPQIPSADANGLWIHCLVSFTGNPNNYNADFIEVYARDFTVNATKLAFYAKMATGSVGVGCNDNTGVYNNQSISGFTVSADTLYRIDVHAWQDGADMKVDLYINENFETQAIIAGRNHKDFSYCLFRSPGSGGAAEQYTYYSEFIFADENTQNLRVATLYPVSNGNYTDGTGDYTDVDEGPAHQDEDYVSFTAANQRKTFQMSDLTPVAGAYAIKGVGINMRSKSNPDGTPLDFIPSLRLGAIDYDAAAAIGNGTALDSLATNVWVVNPNTGIDWLEAEVNSLEAGLKVTT